MHIANDSDPELPRNGGHVVPADLPAESVRAQLGKILTSPRFVRSERSSRLLCFVVEKTLLGDADQIKEYVLGVEVLGRGDSFNPQLDPIARVEAGRLRKKLDAYYQTEGRNDSIRIELPKGRYVPAFSKREPPPAKLALIRPPWVGSLKGWQKAALANVALSLAVVTILWTGIPAGRKLAASKLAATTDSVRSARAGREALLEPTGPSIVVLPFTDLSPKKDQEYFSDGLTEELIATLAMMPGLRVVSRTSAFYFKGTSIDIRSIGKQLDVDMVLEGGVRRAGSQVRVTAQLINATDGYHLWAETYDGQVKDVLSFQRRLAKAITDTLSVELASASWVTSFERYSPRREALDLYLMGLYHARKWTEPELKQGIQRFEQAVEQDPNNALAYAGLAECYALLATQAGSAPTEVMPKAKAAVLKALEIDSALPGAHAVLGTVKGVYEWDWKGAEQEFGHAFELKSDDADVHVAYVWAYLLPRGDLEGAQSEIERVRRHDPASPRVYTVSGLIQYFERRYDEAITQYRKALELDPHFYPAHLALASAYEAKFMFGEAAAEMEKGKSAATPDMELCLLGHKYALMGKRAEAQAVLDRLEGLSRQSYVSGVHISELCADLGDRDKALEWLEKAYQQRSAWLVCLKLNPHFDSLRSDPRFVALLKKIGL